MSRLPQAVATALLAVLLSPSCSLFKKRTITGEREESVKTEQEAAAEMGNPFITGIAQDPNAQKYNVTTSEELERIDNGTEEELIWVDPDKPDAGVEALDSAFSNRAKGNGWLSDLRLGAKLSRKKNLPLILWIHDSVISPASKELGRDLLETKRFLKWCEDNVVCVRVDAGVSITPQVQGKKYSLSAVRSMQHRFGVRKVPALIVFSPQGKIMERVDGYEDSAAEVEIALRNGVTLSEDATREYREKLMAKGYREWTSNRGEKLFAKLQRLDEAKNFVYLKEAGGRISKTKLSRFCQKDIDYLDELARDGKAPK